MALGSGERGFDPVPEYPEPFAVAAYKGVAVLVGKRVQVQHRLLGLSMPSSHVFCTTSLLFGDFIDDRL